MTRFLVVGEINADVVLTGGRLPSPGRESLFRDQILTLGSASAICATGLAKLGNDVLFAGLVGDDLFGRFCLAEMEHAGIDVSHVALSAEARTGVTVSLSSGDDRALATFTGATEAFSLDQLPSELLVTERYDHLHVSSYYLQKGLRSGLPSLFEGARATGATTSLDPGHDPEERWDSELGAILPLIDVFLPNEAEHRALEGTLDASKSMRVVVKCGQLGARYDRGGERFEVAAPAVPVADTTGAGDSFNAGFLHAFKRGEPPERCLRYGVVAGSLSTRALGGTAAQPSLEELEANVSWA